MALNVLFKKEHNALIGEDFVNPQLVNLATMDFERFCEYMAEGSFASPADIGMVMALIETRLLDLMSLNTRVVCTPGGLTFLPKVSGSISQSQLKSKLEAKQAAHPDSRIDVNRPLTTSDLTTGDLWADIVIEVPKKWHNRFMQRVKFRRVNRVL